MSLLSTQLSASGTVFTGRGKLRGIWFVGGATAGSLVFKDGGSSGTTVMTINTPGITTSGTTGSGFIPIDEGVLFKTDCYCAVTTTAFTTLLWEGAR